MDCIVYGLRTVVVVTLFGWLVGYMIYVCLFLYFCFCVCESICRTCGCFFIFLETGEVLTQCMRTRDENGGLLDLRQCLTTLRRTRPGEKLSMEDVERAVECLAVPLSSRCYLRSHVEDDLFVGRIYVTFNHQSCKSSGMHHKKAKNASRSVAVFLSLRHDDCQSADVFSICQVLKPNSW